MNPKGYAKILFYSVRDQFHQLIEQGYNFKAVHEKLELDMPYRTFLNYARKEIAKENPHQLELPSRYFREKKPIKEAPKPKGSCFLDRNKVLNDYDVETKKIAKG